MCCNGILLGPYFFEGKLTGETTEKGIFQRLWWIQDGAPPYKLLAVRRRLLQVFGNCVVALYYEVEWPQISSDLTQRDFFVGLFEITSICYTPLKVPKLILIEILQGQWKNVV